MRRRNKFDGDGEGEGDKMEGKGKGDGELEGGEAGGEYFIIVVEDEGGKVVGTGGLVVERKL